MFLIKLWRRGFGKLHHFHESISVSNIGSRPYMNCFSLLCLTPTHRTTFCVCVCVLLSRCGVRACESVCYLFCDGSWEGEWGEYVYLYVAAYALMNTEWMSFQNCPYKGGSPPIEEKNHTNTSLGTYVFWST